MQLRPFLNAKVSSIKPRARAFEIFIELVSSVRFIYTCQCKEDDNGLRGIQNTAQGIVLGLHSRRQTYFYAPAEEIPRRNIAAESIDDY